MDPWGPSWSALAYLLLVFSHDLRQLVLTKQGHWVFPSHLPAPSVLLMVTCWTKRIYQQGICKLTNCVFLHLATENDVIQKNVFLIWLWSWQKTVNMLVWNHLCRFLFILCFLLHIKGAIWIFFCYFYRANISINNCLLTKSFIYFCIYKRLEYVLWAPLPLHLPM